MRKILIILLLSFLFISGVSAYAGGNTQINQNLFFDGKKVGPYIEVSNLHKLGDNGYQYTYSNGVNKYYININGKDFGPYNYVGLAKTFNDGYVYYYRLPKSSGYDTYDYISVNGKIYGPFKKYSDGLVQIGNNGYYIEYFKGNDVYINTNGKEYGPFESADIDGYNFNENSKFHFKYTKNNQSYINIEGKEYGPYDDILEVNKGNFRYIKNDKAFVNLYGKEYGPYDKGDDYINLGPTFISFYSDKISGFSYLKDDKYYLNINGKDYGPYDSIFYDTDKYKGEGFAFRYINDNKYYINKNDKIYGPFESIENLGILLENVYSYTYLKEGEGCQYYMRNKCVLNKKYSYININGKDYGPYVKDSIKINKLGTKSYYFTYINNGEFVNINGKEYGPYKSININYTNEGYIILETTDNKIQIINENGLYKNIDTYENIYFYSLNDSLKVYSYVEGDKNIVNINGKNYSYSDKYFIYEKIGNEGYIYSLNRDGKNYVNVNGKEYGPYDKNVSSENLIVLNDFYGFKYKIDGKKYVNINSVDYGPYDEETYIRLEFIGDDGISYETLKGVGTGLQITNKYYIKNKVSNVVEKKSNPSLDKLLNKIFIKIDKNGEVKAKKVYEGLIVRLDTLLAKNQSAKNKELLNYIKDKVLEKIK